jgi:hypothetical protein
MIMLFPKFVELLEAMLVDDIHQVAVGVSSDLTLMV